MKTQVYGVDPGNSTLKVYNDVNLKVIKNSKPVEQEVLTTIINVVTPGRERRTYKEETGSLEDFIDVTVQSNNKALGRYFVGKLALNEGGSYLKEVDQNGNTKSANFDTYITTLTGIAYDLFQKHKAAHISQRIILGGSLPTEEFYSSGTVATFENRLLGKHTIIFNHPLYYIDGQAPKIELDITNMVTLPESAGAMINYVFDKDGNAIPGREKCLLRLVIVIDVGALTTDVSAMHQNRPIGTLTFGIPKGLFHAIDLVIEDIANAGETKGFRPTRQMIIDSITDELEPYIIPYKREDINIKQYIDKRFNELAKEIFELTKRKLSKERPNIENEAFITFAVGGSIIPLKEQVKKHLSTLQLEIPEDPVGANAKGNYKAARQLQLELSKSINHNQTNLYEISTGK